jgi:hypothetical protein
MSAGYFTLPLVPSHRREGRVIGPDTPAACCGVLHCTFLLLIYFILVYDGPVFDWQNIVSRRAYKRMSDKIFRSILSIGLLVATLAGCSGGGGTASASQSVSQSFSLAWNAPTTYTDGTPLTAPAGYKVYYGTTSGNYTNVIEVHNLTSCLINSLSPGTYYFVVTCYDSSGIESDFSNEIKTTR